jgi:hypothetical protein
MSIGDSSGSARVLAAALQTLAGLWLELQLELQAQQTSR